MDVWDIMIRSCWEIIRALQITGCPQEELRNTGKRLKPSMIPGDIVSSMKTGSLPKRSSGGWLL